MSNTYHKITDNYITLEYTSHDDSFILTVDHQTDPKFKVWLDESEWGSLCAVMDDMSKFLAGPEQVPDLSGIADKAKKDFVESFVELTAKNVLSVFISLGLKTHMDVKVVNDANGDEFRLLFTKKKRNMEPAFSREVLDGRIQEIVRLQKRIDLYNGKHPMLVDEISKLQNKQREILHPPTDE